MQKVQAHDDETGSGSGSSDLSNLDNDTDTLGRAISRHQRDARRIQTLLNGSQRPYRNMPRTTLTDRLQRRGLQHQGPEDVVVVEDVKSRSQYEAEPGLNIPQTWGRKTRVTRDWTRESRIPISTEVPEKVHNPVRVRFDKDVLPYRNEPEDVAWNEQQLGQHASMDDTPPSMKRRRPLSQPTSLRTMNPRLRNIVKANSGDFSDLSLLASTPAMAKDAKSRLPVTAGAHISNVNALQSTLPIPRSRVVSGLSDNLDSNSDKENAPQDTGRHEMQTYHKRLSRASAAGPTPDVQGSLHTTNSHQATKVPTRTNGLLDLEGRRPPAQQQSSSTVHVEPPTPVVTGGWVETPKDERPFEALPRPDQKSTTSALDNVANLDMLKDNYAPPRPALAEIIQSTKIEPEQQLGDTTLPSLQDIITNKEVASSDPPTKKKVAASSASTPATTSERNAEVASQALDKHISAVVAAPKAPIAKPMRKTTVQPAANKPVQTAITRNHIDLNGKTVCKHCGGAYTSVWQGLWFEFRSNFWTRDPGAFLGIRLTRFGTLLFAWMCWYILESVLCFQYCQPLYATSMVGYGVNPNAPIFPFVIPTLIFRPFGFAWRPVTRWLSWLSSIIMNWWMGEEAKVAWQSPVQRRHTPASVRYAYRTIEIPSKWWETASTIATSTSRRAAESTIDAIDDIGRMW